MNIYSQFSVGICRINPKREKNRQIKTSLSNNKTSNISLPILSNNCDYVSFSASINVTKTPINGKKAFSGRLNFLKSIFEFNPEEIEKIMNFEDLLKFINIKNASGHSVNSVLTESLNNINRKVRRDSKNEEEIKRITGFTETIKLVFGLGKSKVSSYVDIKEEKSFVNKQYVQKIFTNKEFINMIKKNLPIVKSKGLFGVKSVKSVDRHTNNTNLFKNRRDFFSSIFQFDEEKIENITNNDELIAFINTKNSSRHSIKSVLIEAIDSIVQQNSSNEKLLKIMDAIKLAAGLEEDKMFSSREVQKVLDFNNPEYVRNKLNNSNIIDMIIENIPSEKAKRLPGVKDIQLKSQIIKQFIQSRINFFSRFFIFDLQEIKKITDLDSLLKFTSIKNSSGCSINSILTESIENIIQQNPTDEKLVNIMNSVKLAIHNTKTTELDLKNAQYLVKIMDNPKFVNMIIKNIPPESVKNLNGIKGIQSQIEEQQYSDKFILSRIKILSRIFDFDIQTEDISKVIKDYNSFIKLMNIKNSSGQTINQLLTEALGKIDQREANIDVAYSLLFGLKGEKMSTYKAINGVLHKRHVQRVFDLINSNRTINMLISNIPAENRSFSIIDNFNCNKLKLTKKIETQEVLPKLQKEAISKTRIKAAKRKTAKLVIKKPNTIQPNPNNNSTAVEIKSDTSTKETPTKLLKDKKIPKKTRTNSKTRESNRTELKDSSDVKSEKVSAELQENKKDLPKTSVDKKSKKVNKVSREEQNSTSLNPKNKIVDFNRLDLKKAMLSLREIKEALRKN